MKTIKPNTVGSEYHTKNKNQCQVIKNQIVKGKF